MRGRGDVAGWKPLSEIEPDHRRSDVSSRVHVRSSGDKDPRSLYSQTLRQSNSCHMITAALEVYDRKRL